VLNFCYLLSYYFTFSDIFYVRDPISRSNYLSLLINANFLFLLINLIRKPKLEKVYATYILFVAGYLGIIILLRGYDFSRLFHLYFLVFLFVSLTFLKFSNFVRLLGKYLLPNVLEQTVILIGDDIDESIIQYINARPGNYKCVGLLCDNPQEAEHLKGLYRGGVDRLETVLEKDVVDEILISTSLLSVEKIDQVIKTAAKYHATASVLPPYFQFLSSQSYRTEGWMGVPIISVYHSKLAIRSHRLVKRGLDIALSVVFLLTVFPLLLLVIAPAIWISNRGPIFFKQLRKGYKQQPFLCYKFRTMRNDTGLDETVQARPKDPRLIGIGASLRKKSIDEIPQFLNVLFGNMSVVGPRPHMVEHDELFEKYIARYNVRFVTKPGITGWAQINGLRGSVEGNPDLLEKRIEHDLWYIRNWSIWLDLKIIYMTAVKLILKGDSNAY
jgi:exopolysaccharide biosynthesis polyprenyl glycosylphosphotransferase